MKNMVMACEQFVVVDAKTGEPDAQHLACRSFWKKKQQACPCFQPVAGADHSLYGHTMQGLMGTVSDQNIQNFIDLQGRPAENSVMILAKPLMQQNFMGGYLSKPKYVCPKCSSK